MAMAGSRSTTIWDDHPIEPALRDGTANYRGRVLKEVTLWSVTSATPFHWITSFSFADQIQGETYGGISLNMSKPMRHEGTPAGHPNYLGSLDIQVRPNAYLISRRSVVTVTAKLVEGVTVGHIVDFIRQRRMHHYAFSQQGSGCMYWQFTLLGALVSSGWIRDPNFLAEIQGQIEEAHKKYGQTLIPYPPVAGQFYTTTT
ncbi:hypothetical protein F5I97DRAFT_1927484 [Phlebopus sp. FC_14]|nr:hypothetical protein F5I97DRAFT_1927484 [Phlebopus sp. FC_14]